MFKRKRKLLAMLLSNNTGATKQQQLLDGAPFLAKLTHTAVPTRGSITTTFTRATTSTWPNNDGYLVTGVAGEIGFVGARRVRNLLTFTEDLSNAAWTKINGGAGTAPTITSGFTDPDGGSTAFRIQANAGGSGGGDYSVVRQVAVGGNLRAIYVKSNTGVSQEIYFGAPVSGQKVTATTSWSRVTAPLIGGNSNYDIGSYGTAGNSTTNVDILVWHPQLEDVTAQTTQTAGEYVSVGVESAPYYHGSFVDGVKCYDTDRSGNPISTSGSYPLVGYVPWEARTNLCLQSNAFDNASWTANNTTVTANAAVAPDGTTTADYLKDAAGGPFAIYTYQTITRVASTAYIYSVYVKAADYSTIDVGLSDNVSGQIIVTANLATGVVTTAAAASGNWTSVTSGIVDAGNGWYRVYVAGTGGAGTTMLARVGRDVRSGSSTGDTAKGLYVWGAQVELGAFATPYIPTTTTAVTRNADVLTYTGGDIANLKTLRCEFERAVGVSSVGVAAVLTDGDNADTASIYMASATAASFAGTTASASQWSVAASNAYTPGITTSMAFSMATNDIKMDKDGTAQTQDTSATPPACTQLQIGHQNGAFQLNGPVGGIYGWPRNLSQSELRVVTS